MSFNLGDMLRRAAKEPPAKKPPEADLSAKTGAELLAAHGAAEGLTPADRAARLRSARYGESSDADRQAVDREYFAGLVRQIRSGEFVRATHHDWRRPDAERISGSIVGASLDGGIEIDMPRGRVCLRTWPDTRYWQFFRRTLPEFERLWAETQARHRAAREQERNSLT